MELALSRLVRIMAVALLVPSACGAEEPGSPPAGPYEPGSSPAGESVAASPDPGNGSGTRCSIPTERADEPVTQEHAERLAARSVGVDALEDVAATKQAATVCGRSLEVWRVSGRLPNGDDAVSLIDVRSGTVVKSAISGGSD